MGHKITGKNVIAMLEAVVAEQGADKVYNGYDGPKGNSYLYAHPDEPGCIVGHVMAKFTPDLYKVVEAYESTPDSIIHVAGVLESKSSRTGTFNSSRFPKLGTQISGPARDVLRAAQEVQDDAQPWGDALQAAREKAAELGLR